MLIRNWHEAWHLLGVTVKWAVVAIAIVGLYKKWPGVGESPRIRAWATYTPALVLLLDQELLPSRG